jgi:hypothetical protein
MERRFEKSFFCTKKIKLSAEMADCKKRQNFDDACNFSYAITVTNVRACLLFTIVRSDT